MLQISLLLMKCLNKTETPIFLSVVCSLFPNAIFLTFVVAKIVLIENYRGPPCPKYHVHVKNIF